MQQHQTATLQTILQMVDDPNRPGTAEDSMKEIKIDWDKTSQCKSILIIYGTLPA